MKIPVGLSNRHVHISEEDLEVLFGEDYNLTELKDLSQPGQYACEEKVDVVGPRGKLEGVRILGPTRDKTQIEISTTDAFTIGVKPMLRNSGDIEGTPGAKIVGPKGEVELKEGLIVAARHIHMHTKDAENFGLKDEDVVKVETEGDRGVIFKNVLVRVSDAFQLELHLDMEEGNAAGLKNGDTVNLIK